MIWALIFTILLTLLGGGSPFVIPKLDNYVKKHVVDDVRKKQVVSLLKVAKKERKKTVKRDKKILKKLTKLAKSREAAPEDFDNLYEEMLQSYTGSQNANIKVNQKSQELITAGEWEAIMTDVIKNFEKTDKKRKKALKKMEKKFLKWENKIKKNIADAEKRKKAIELVEKHKSLYVKNYRIIQDELRNENSVMYKYKASEEEVSALQNRLTELVDEVYTIDKATHFKLVELTTPEEWKKIM